MSTHHIRTAALMGLSLAAGLSAFAWLSRRMSRTSELRIIRNAGPAAMLDPPQDWDMTDEASDESFPASDPPSGY